MVRYDWCIVIVVFQSTCMYVYIFLAFCPRWNFFFYLLNCKNKWIDMIIVLQLVICLHTQTRVTINFSSRCTVWTAVRDLTVVKVFRAVWEFRKYSVSKIFFFQIPIRVVCAEYSVKWLFSSKGCKIISKTYLSVYVHTHKCICESPIPDIQGATWGLLWCW